MLSQKDEFKVGLLEKFADDGLSFEESLQVVQLMKQRIKQALEGANDGGSWPIFGPIQNAANEAVDLGASGIKKVMDSGLGWGLPMLGVAPFMAGAGLGYAGARATDIDDDDVEAAKKRELIALYQQYATQVRDRDRLHQTMAHR